MNGHHYYSLVALSLTVVAMAGCVGTSPPVDLYTLSALERSAGQTQPDKSEKALAIAVGPASFPESLDRPQIVTRKGPNRLHADEFQRWGGPLQENFLRVLGENLSLLLATPRVVVFPADAPFPVDFRVLLQVQQFEGALGKEVVLNSRWAVIREGDRMIRVLQSVIREPVASDDYGALVAAESKTLAALSREIADTITSLANR